MEHYLVILGLVTLIALLIGGIVAVAGYIVTSYSLYKIAKKRGIANAWMSWIPVLSKYIVGKIADEYDSRNGFRRKWGVVLLTLAIIVFIGAVGLSVAYIGMCSIIFSAAAYNEAIPVDMLSDLINSAIAFYAITIVTSIVSPALVICHYICLFKIYESAVGQKALKYLLLTFFVPFANLVCISICSSRVQEIQPVQSAQSEQPTQPETEQ